MRERDKQIKIIERNAAGDELESSGKGEAECRTTETKQLNSANLQAQHSQTFLCKGKAKKHKTDSDRESSQIRN